MKKYFIVLILALVLGGCSMSKKIEKVVSIPQDSMSTSTSQVSPVDEVIDTVVTPMAELGGGFSYTNEVLDGQGNTYFVLKNNIKGDPDCLYSNVLKDKEIPAKCKQVGAACHDRRETDDLREMVTICDLYKKSKDGEAVKIKRVYDAAKNTNLFGFNPDKKSLHDFTMLEYKAGKMLILYGTDYSNEFYKQIAWFDLKKFSVEDIYHDYKIGDYGYASFQNRQDELIIISDNESSHFVEAPEYVQKLDDGVYYRKNGLIKKIEDPGLKFVFPSYIYEINKSTDIPAEGTILFKAKSDAKSNCVNLYSFDVKTEKFNQTGCIQQLPSGTE